VAVWSVGFPHRVLARKHSYMTRSSALTSQHPTYTRIYAVVRQIPAGKVASYGQIARIVGNCTPRMVGYAMAAETGEHDVPWHRVINAQGKISLRADGGGAQEQRARLEQEGIAFDSQQRVNWLTVGWEGPDLHWLLAHGYDPTPAWLRDRPQRA
jgi:methylated-DNA-protein-cysteine methyltransferase related protein